MTDGEHSAVERQHVVVVVVDRESGVDRGGRAGSEIETVEATLLRIYERLAVAGPVGRLKRSPILVHDGRITAGDVQDLEIAADIVPVRNEIARRRDGDPDVAERRPLHDGVVVRADEE